MKRARYYHRPHRAKPHEVRYYDKDGIQQYAYYEKDKKTEALAFVEKCNKEAGLPEELLFSVSERMVLSQIKGMCDKAGLPLEQARDYVKEKIRQISTAKQMGIGDAWELFEKNLNKRSASAETIDFYRRYVLSFQNHLKIKSMLDFMKLDYNIELPLTASPAHYKRALSAFLEYCKSQNIIKNNPLKDIKLPKNLKEKKIPEVLSVADTYRLLAEIPEIWKPAFAVLMFAGIRGGELITKRRPGIKISAIDFDAKKITIDSSASKMRRKPRIILNPPPNIWPWLEPLKEKDGREPVAAGNYEAFRSAKRKTNVNLSQGVTRHSFGSYGYHAISPARTIEIMGHTKGKDIDTFFEYYKGLATPGDAKRYFKITPRAVEIWKWVQKWKSAAGSPEKTAK